MPSWCHVPYTHRKILWIAPHAKWQHAAEKLRCAPEAFRSASHSACALVGAFPEHKASVCNSSHTCAVSRQLVDRIACFCQDPWPKDQSSAFKCGFLRDYGARPLEQSSADSAGFNNQWMVVGKISCKQDLAQTARRTRHLVDKLVFAFCCSLIGLKKDPRFHSGERVEEKG